MNVWSSTPIAHGALDSPVGDPKFIGATQHLQHTLAKLKGALAEWEATMPTRNPQEMGVSVAATADMVIGAADMAMSAIACQQKPMPTRMNSAAPIFQPSWGADAQQTWQSGAEKVPLSIADCLSQETLRTNLRELERMDHTRILIVRRINRLGLESPTWLKAHFSLSGAVDKVLIAHSRGKASYHTGKVRVRPAGLGFIVMDTAADAQAVLSAGKEQVINGVTITVQPYEVREGETLYEDSAADGEMRFQ